MGGERSGFGSMNKEQQLKLASMGGTAAHKKGTAHEWTAEEARAAGRKGGKAVHAKKRAAAAAAAAAAITNDQLRPGR